jgi:hypothetical protein
VKGEGEILAGFYRNGEGEGEALRGEGENGRRLLLGTCSQML